MKEKKYEGLIGGGVVGAVIALLIVGFTPIGHLHFGSMSMDGHVDDFNTMRMDLTSDLLHEGHYQCCLEKPCVYCLAKHGECECLEDVLAGKHPCGECIGEILEGHGNEFLAKYFATAIAEKVGEQHTYALKMMISDMYGISVEEQV